MTPEDKLPMIYFHYMYVASTEDYAKIRRIFTGDASRITRMKSGRWRITAMKELNEAYESLSVERCRLPPQQLIISS